MQHVQHPLRSSRHPIQRETPAVNFFEGALLGNGGMGCVVCSRPDAVMIHFGHNNVWDIRINEEHKDEYGTFQSVFEKLRAVVGQRGLVSGEDDGPFFVVLAKTFARTDATNPGTDDKVISTNHLPGELP